MIWPRTQVIVTKSESLVFHYLLLYYPHQQSSTWSCHKATRIVTLLLYGTWDIELSFQAFNNSPFEDRCRFLYYIHYITCCKNSNTWLSWSIKAWFWYFIEHASFIELSKEEQNISTHRHQKQFFLKFIYRSVSQGFFLTSHVEKLTSEPCVYKAFWWAFCHYLFQNTLHLW